MRCSIEAPDALAAFSLARRIDLLGQETDLETDGRAFRVVFDTEADALPTALRTVQLWLELERIPQTTVRFGSRAESIRAA